MSGQAGRLAVQGGVIVSHAPPKAHWAVQLFRDIAILTAPVVAAVVTLVVAWEMRDVPLTLFDGVLSPPRQPELYPSTWLTVGHAVVPSIFLIGNLVNRRYGDNYTIAWILASWALAAITAIAILFRWNANLPSAGDVPSVRVAASFLGAMALGQLAGTFVFDRTRGVVWWNAPLYSALTSSFVAMFLFYPLAYLGSDWIWLNHMSVDTGVKAAMSFALLLPYLALRPIVRPSAGLGGF
jgi:uncharacterized PurR-regulated membrane protein YhhQ (DUF165 family)